MDRDELAAIQSLAERVQVFVRSMTWRGPTATPAERVSWIEALGWFAGRDVAARLAEVAVDRSGADDEIRNGTASGRP